MYTIQPTSPIGNTPSFQNVYVTNGVLTLGDITRSVSSELRSVFHKFSWTNSQIAGLSGTTGNLKVCTLPVKTIVKSVRVVITGQAAGATTLTCSLGRTATGYIDYVVAKNAKATANTIYGSIVADLGANLSALVGDLPSLTATTDMNLQFASSIENLSNVTGSSGDIYLETITLP